MAVRRRLVAFNKQTICSCFRTASNWRRAIKTSAAPHNKNHIELIVLASRTFLFGRFPSGRPSQPAGTLCVPRAYCTTSVHGPRPPDRRQPPTHVNNTALETNGRHRPHAPYLQLYTASSFELPAELLCRKNCWKSWRHGVQLQRRRVRDQQRSDFEGRSHADRRGLRNERRVSMTWRLHILVRMAREHRTLRKNFKFITANIARLRMRRINLTSILYFCTV